jgi:hypothetical protein
MPLQATSGAASYDAFGGGVAAVPNYIEECFSTTLYTGNGSTQTITNGIDLAGKGGLVWTKSRTTANNHLLRDTARGTNLGLYTNNTSAQIDGGSDYSLSLTASSYTMTGGDGDTNNSGTSYASWAFREQPKFFDVVTYTGNGTSQNISHNLGSVPGCIIVKCTSTTNDWRVYHRSLATVDSALRLNSPAAAGSSSTFWNSTAPTSTQFTVGSDGSVNASGATYVAYIFAHNAGGFGLTGTDNVISCGSFTVDGSGAGQVNLGYEAQWVLTKNLAAGGAWNIVDTMRGLTVDSGYEQLLANSSGAAVAWTTPYLSVNNQGFGYSGQTSGSQWIYIAIRRGPMKVPTTGTSVFAPVAQASFNAYSVGFPTDLAMGAIRGGNALNTAFGDRLRGGTQYLVSSSTAAEANDPGGLFYFDLQNSMDQGLSSSSSVFWNFRRAPGFFDEVCYTTGAGTGITTFNHNLAVTPELVISKVRSATDDWYVYAQPLGTSKTLYLNANVAEQGFTCTDSLSSTQARTTLGVGAATAVSYLFASAPGVSKVGSYTGTGTTQVINCGFTAGSRFVMIKRTDSTGDWYVWDSARGIVAGNDPHLSLNTTAAEVTSNDTIDTDSTGFVVNQVSATNVNVSSATYIFLAIA